MPALGRRNTELVSGADLIIATPSDEHVPDLVFTGVTKTPIPYAAGKADKMVFISEIRNDNSTANIDWVEFYNAGTEAVGLRGWELAMIKGSDGKAADLPLVGWDEEHTPAGWDAMGFSKNENWNSKLENFCLSSTGIRPRPYSPMVLMLMA